MVNGPHGTGNGAPFTAQFMSRWWYRRPCRAVKERTERYWAAFIRVILSSPCVMFAKHPTPDFKRSRWTPCHVLRSIWQHLLNAELAELGMIYIKRFYKSRFKSLRVTYDFEIDLRFWFKSFKTILISTSFSVRPIRPLFVASEQWGGLRPSVLGQDRSETKNRSWSCTLWSWSWSCRFDVSPMLWNTVCYARCHNNLEEYSNFSSAIYSSSILWLDRHYRGDQQWLLLT